MPASPDGPTPSSQRLCSFCAANRYARPVARRCTRPGGLLVFLTLRPGDTDDDYFAGYTADQRKFIASEDIDELQSWAEELEGVTE
jgi:hypothetical protein